MPAGRPSVIKKDIIIVNLIDWSYEVKHNANLGDVAKHIDTTYVALYRMAERLKGYLITATCAVFPFALFGHLGFDAEMGIVNVQYRAELLKAIHTRKKEKN